MSVKSLPLSLIKTPQELKDSRHSKDCTSEHSPVDAFPSADNAFAISVTRQGMQSFRLGLHAVSTLLCLVLVGIGVKLAEIPGPIFILLPPSGLCILWNVGCAVALAVGLDRRFLHPCIRVAVDIIFWLGFGAASILMAAVWSTWSLNMPQDRYGPELLGFVKAAVVVAVVEAFVHISFFVVACYDTHVEKRFKKANQPQRKPSCAAPSGESRGC